MSIHDEMALATLEIMNEYGEAVTFSGGASDVSLKAYPDRYKKREKDDSNIDSDDVRLINGAMSEAPVNGWTCLLRGNTYSVIDSRGVSASGADAAYVSRLRNYDRPISIQSRSIRPPVSGSVDQGLGFTEKHAVNAVIRTVTGETFFDGVSTDQVITHRFGIDYLSGITAEDWIVFSGRRFDIVNVENVSEENTQLVLHCTDKGIKEAGKA